MKRFFVLIGCLVLMSLQSCGQSGPLYLPEPAQKPTEEGTSSA